MKNKINTHKLKTNFNKLKKYLKDSKGMIIVYIILSLFSICIGIILPILSAKMIVELTSNMLYEVLLMAIVYYFITFLDNLSVLFFRKIALKIENKVNYNLRKDTASAILKYTDSVIDNVGTGKIITRMQSDTGEITSSFNDTVNQAFNLIEAIGTFIGIFIVSKVMFVYIIIKQALYIGVIKNGADKELAEDKKYRKVREEAASISSELVRGQKDIKMLNSEESFKSKFNDILLNFSDEYYKKNYIGVKYDFYYDTLYVIFEFLEKALLVLLISKGRLDIAGALVVYNYSSKTKYIGYIIDYILKQINKFNLSCDRVFELINSKTFEKEKFGNKHLNHINGDFEFKDVYFSYGEKEVLKGMNFKVDANTTVAFAGKSGVGKTTIFSLLCKMYDNYKGLITIDGVDIRALDKDSIRGNITIVSQNPYIFNLSIRDNLKLVKEDVTEDEIIDALKKADLYDFVRNLPKGLDTVVGEGGVSLSGGERQRLAIARAFIQKTEIILFDEATSSLDNETQASITNAINNLKKNYTILIIAHRLSTIKNASKIIYIEDGKNIKEGTHEELLKTCKGYKKLYESEVIKN